MFIPISKLLISDRAGDTPVARISGEDRSFADLTAEIAHLCLHIRSRGVNQVVLATKSSYAFVCGMLAAFQTDCRIIVPPNALPGMLTHFVKMECPLMSDICDIGDDNQIVIDGKSGVEPTFKELDPDQCYLDFYTSGSTGQPKRVPKSLAQIENELIVLDQIFGAKLNGAATLGTVSHQHIFGLYFKCLLPLCEGRVFFPEIFEIWEELLAAAPPRSCFVSSPAHLTRIPPFDPLPHEERTPVIFTAGGPLPFEAAQDASVKFGTLPTEIFGSTETGGVAHRQQKDPRTPFTPLPGVQTRIDTQQLLSVKSIYTDGADWDVTNDIVELLEDGSFILAGRANQFVKIEGKRISLIEVEKYLIQSDYVRDAAVFILKEDRATLVAVVELSAPGWQRHQEIGGFRLNRILRRELSPYLENAALPRRWRFVGRLPINAQGKRQQASLDELFASEEGAD
ncbi:AMP-binding protein [Sneathiella litorea]|uniref:AMP-binding protein n=1 Tax=Sneathiella litorea TaxID=2606216 RepID=A0A6L8WC05_9PROT|nr:AMP-binding protein [Sneathiella litorea]MZR32219.1 AMP-binding protein [Sneathiella litorea]